MPIGSFTHQTDLAGGKVRLNKACLNGRCRFGPTIHLQKTEGETHDAILHGLDRKVGKLLFSKEPFEPTIDSWNGMPLVFAQAHPEPKDPSAKVNPAIFGQNRAFTQDELDRIDGAIIGEASDAFIESSGHPKLIFTQNFTDETAIRMFDQGLINEDQLAKSQAAVPVALKLLEEGKLSHSSGFICPDDGERLTGTVVPNHILEFEETERDQPLDRMSVVLNKTEGNDVIGKSQTNVGKVMSKKNQGRLKDLLDGISAFFDDMAGGPDTPSPKESKTNQEIVATTGTMNTPDGESLEGQIENVRRALSDHVGLRWPDGTPRSVWGVMTMPDKVIWQHPDTSQYYATPYTVEGEGTVSFGQPEEVEQAYVVKEANTVFLNMTAADLDTIVKRNKEQEPKMAPTPEENAAATAQKQKDDALAAKDAEIARLQKERDDLAAEKAQVQKNKFDAAWADLKKNVIPPAEVKDPADEVKLQKMSIDDPLGFAAKVATWKNAPAMGEEGTGHVSGPDAKAKDAADTDRILKASAGRAIPGTLHR